MRGTDAPLFLSHINTITMALDPRKNLVDVCPPTETATVTDKRNFFQNVGKVGDLEVLNHVNSDIGKGLRTLRGMSEAVRTDVSVVPGSKGESIGIPSIIKETGAAVLDAGADFVLDTMNLNSRQTREQATTFSPQVANRALGQAESI